MAGDAPSQKRQCTRLYLLCAFYASYPILPSSSCPHLGLFCLNIKNTMANPSPTEMNCIVPSPLLPHVQVEAKVNSSLDKYQLPKFMHGKQETWAVCRKSKYRLGVLAIIHNVYDMISFALQTNYFPEDLFFLQVNSHLIRSKHRELIDFGSPPKNQ